MKIIVIEENGKLFGETEMIGIGVRKPKLIYGEKVKELRENNNLTIEELAKEFEVRPNIINKIEEQKASLDSKMLDKYIEKFKITKEYLFDLDLECLILSIQGNVLANFETSDECKQVYNLIKKEYLDALKENKNYILVDFNSGKNGGKYVC